MVSAVDFMQVETTQAEVEMKILKLKTRTIRKTILSPLRQSADQVFLKYLKTRYSRENVIFFEHLG